MLFMCAAADLLSGQEGTGVPLQSAAEEEQSEMENAALPAGVLPEADAGSPAEAEPAAMPAASPEEEMDDAAVVYYIKDIIFDRSGKRIRTGLSWPYFLLHQGDFKIGECIIGRDNLDTYRQDKTQLLMNHRVLDYAYIDLVFEEPDAEGSVPVILQVTTVDTATLIALPQPRFDDNDGFRLVLKARDYNFLGTMTPLRFDFGYEYDKNKEEHSIFSLIDSDIPFRLFGYTWNFDFDHYFSYTPEAPFHYKNTSGLSMELPVRFTAITFGLAEEIVANEDNKTAYSEEFKDPLVEQEEGRYKEFYMSTALSASWKIPTRFFVGKFGELTYTPKIEEKFNYTPGGDIGGLRRGARTSLSHSLGFGRVDWIDNFRSGVDASIGNTNTYNSFKNSWSNSVDVSVAGHVRIFSFFGFSGRLRYRDWFQDTYSEAGDSLRGIRDDDFPALRTLSLSMDFPFRVFMFMPSIWFNAPWLRFMNIEFHLGPIVDAAFAVAPDKPGISADNIRVTAGLELIAFSHFWRNLYLRLSGGVDLRQVMNISTVADRSVWEIFLGMEHHF
ncbi:MAG: hypothetical protein LBF74_09300 [Treponema sp.]|nr:hypothetical protein [Treponema sp.]